MPDLLTPAQAANFVRSNPSDAVMLQLLPLINKFIERATGRDWTQDVTLHPLAIATAGMVLVQWYDNPSQIGQGGSMPSGIESALAQLEAEALRYRKYEFRGITGVGYIYLPGAIFGDVVIKLIGVYGVFGDQSANFESAIQYDGALHQLTTANCFWNRYAIVLKSPGDDVYP
jgi:predicted membrane-bound mannosyltransferase